MTDGIDAQTRDALTPPPSRPLDARNSGVTFALSQISLETGRILLRMTQQQRRIRLQEQLRNDIERTQTAEQHADERLASARRDHLTTFTRLRARNALEERLRLLSAAIRRKRHELEAKKIADELDRLETERKATTERLGSDRTKQHEVELADWTTRSDERKQTVDRLAAARTEAEKAASELRAAAAGRMNRWMTRTTAGFLVWAGYTVIWATGVSVACLLDDGQKRSMLTDVGKSAIKLMGDLGGRSLHPMIAAPLFLLVFLLSVVLLLVGIDALMRRFDKRGWLDSSQKNTPTRFQFPTKENLTRAAFSKLLIAIPFIYISGVAIAFVAYGGQVASNTIQIGKTNSILNAIIGSALSLLASSIFVLYFVNIFEPRASSDDRHWRQRWEVGVVPLFLLGAVVLIAIFGPHSRWAWAGVAAFMLLGAMALAYGVLYRGMFRELDYGARAVNDCDRRIEDALRKPEIEDPDRTEQREIERVLSDYRARRQYLLDLDRERRLRRTFLTSDENDPAMIAAYHIASSFLWKVWVRFRRIGPQPDFYRTTDFEAAPVETELRQECERQIRELDLELQVLTPEVATARFETCEREHDLARQEYERAERQQPLAIAANDEREATELFDFEEAYALGIATKPAYDTIVKRRDATLEKAERPRVKRLRPEVSSGN